MTDSNQGLKTGCPFISHRSLRWLYCVRRLHAKPVYCKYKVLSHICVELLTAALKKMLSRQVCRLYHNYDTPESPLQAHHGNLLSCYTEHYVFSGIKVVDIPNEWTALNLPLTSGIIFIVIIIILVTGCHFISRYSYSCASWIVCWLPHNLNIREPHLCL